MTATRTRMLWLGLLARLFVCGDLVADEAESKAVWAITNRHGGVFRDEKAAGKPVIEVFFFPCFPGTPVESWHPVVDTDIKKLAKELATLKKLRTLDLSHTEVTDAGLKELSPLKQLRTLKLSGSITDTGLKALAALPQLQTLDLHSTDVTDAGLKHLAAFEQLRSLDLGGTKITS